MTPVHTWRCRSRFGVALAGVTLLASGCLVGPDFKRPAVEQPSHFKSQADDEAGPPVPAEWWKLYRDPELDRLIATAQASNQNIRLAVARVDQARALARVAGSFLYPTITADPRFSHTTYSANRISANTGRKVVNGPTVNDWLLPIDLSYEIDVWGRVRRGLESAHATAAATADDVGVVRLTVETDVARYYYTLRSLDAQIEILTETVTAYQEQVRVLSAQFRAGLVGAIVVNQAQAQLEATQAQLRDLQRARADQEHALAILCGRPAPSFAVAANPLHESTPPAVPPGLPAQLLARRPDVAEAEQNVRAANAQIGVATADFYPRFTLTGTAGFESFDASSLFTWQSRVASIMPSISIPIFEGGRLRATLAASKAFYEQTVATYVNQVLVAYGDVEDALTDLHALSDEVGRLRDAVGASQSYLRLAQVQYRQGLADYLLVIDAERTLLANQLSLAQAVNLQMGASIHLIKALGGGWNPSEDRSGVKTRPADPSRYASVQLEHLAGTQDLQRELVSRLRLFHALADPPHHDVTIAELDTPDGEDDVAPHHDVLAVDTRHAVAALDAGHPRWRSTGDRLHQEAGRLGHIEDLRDLAGDHQAFDAGPECLVLEQQPACRIRGDDEAEAFAAPGLRNIVAHDADHPPGQVEHRPAGISLVDRSRGLEKLGERHRPIHRVRRVPRADPANAQRTSEPVRRADDEDLVADADRVGVPERRRHEGTRRRVDAQQREIRGGFGGNDTRRSGRPAHELDGNLVHRLHDVGGRHHVALRRDDDAGADFRDVREPAAVDADVTAPAANDDDAGARLVEDGAHILGG